MRWTACWASRGVARPNYIELARVARIPILYEDRTLIAIDKPAGWMLVPVSWQKTNRNLQAALLSSIEAGDFWARSRHIKFLKYIHRLDAETTGILLLGKSRGALATFEDMFEGRKMEKVYLAITSVEPRGPSWTCRLSLAPDPREIGRMVADKLGKAAETEFRVLASANGLYLVEARPYTGRTHQIRVHMAQSGCPIVGDELYGQPPIPKPREQSGQRAPGLRQSRKLECSPVFPMGLRAVRLSYQDPFTRRRVEIRAPLEEYLAAFGFDASVYA